MVLRYTFLQGYNFPGQIVTKYDQNTAICSIVIRLSWFSKMAARPHDHYLKSDQSEIWCICRGCPYTYSHNVNRPIFQNAITHKIFEILWCRVPFAQNIMHVLYDKTHKHWHLKNLLWLGFHYTLLAVVSRARKSTTATDSANFGNFVERGHCDRRSTQHAKIPMGSSLTSDTLNNCRINEISIKLKQ
jgi:hypothetical protein